MIFILLWIFISTVRLELTITLNCFLSKVSNWEISSYHFQLSQRSNWTCSRPSLWPPPIPPGLFPVSPVLLDPNDFTCFSVLAWTVPSAIATVSAVVSLAPLGSSLFSPYSTPIHQSWIHLSTALLVSLSVKKGCGNSYNKDETSIHTLAKGLHCC